MIVVRMLLNSWATLRRQGADAAEPLGLQQLLPQGLGFVRRRGGQHLFGRHVCVSRGSRPAPPRNPARGRLREEYRPRRFGRFTRKCRRGRRFATGSRPAGGIDSPPLPAVPRGCADRMRYAICNETFDGWDHARVCGLVAGLGLRRPGNRPVHPRPRASPTCQPERRARDAAARPRRPACSMIGLHWLLAKTEGFAPHLARRGGPPAHRRTTWSSWPALPPTSAATSSCSARRPSGASRPGRTPRAGRRLRLRHAAAAACRRWTDTGVELCLEPLSPPEADFLNTAAEAVGLDRAGSGTRA